MINKLKKLYPNYLIIIKKDNKLYDINKKELQDKTIFNNTNYIIIDDNSYEVHKKIRH